MTDKKLEQLSYDQLSELINHEFAANGENLVRTVEKTGLPTSIVMEAVGIKDMLDFMDEENDDDEDDFDWDINAHDDVPDAGASESTTD